MITSWKMSIIEKNNDVLSICQEADGGVGTSISKPTRETMTFAIANVRANFSILCDGVFQETSTDFISDWRQLRNIYVASIHILEKEE